MNLPADLREGWYWVRWERDSQWEGDLGIEVVYLRRNRVNGEWRVERIGEEKSRALEMMLRHWTALEPVAPPSWERGDG